MRDELNFLHLDLDAFYASVEEIDNPKLKGRPMVVGGRSQRGIITTANYQARKFGLHSAMPIFQAKTLCPNVIIVPVRHERYEEVSRKVFSLLDKYSPKIEQMSIDEGCMDISHLDIEPEILAKLIQDDISIKTGLTLSIGISYNKSLAKLASDWNKPQGVKIIDRSMMPQILMPLPVGKILGVGKKTEAKLKSMGIYKVEDLYSVPKTTLEYHFGKSGGLIYERIRGIDNRQVDTQRERKSLGIERTFSKNIHSKKHLHQIIKDFSKKLHIELVERKLLGRTLQVKIKYSNFHTITRSYTYQEATRELKEIYEKTIYLFKDIPLDRPIRLFGLTMANLQDDDIQQLNFLR